MHPRRTRRRRRDPAGFGARRDLWSRPDARSPQRGRPAGGDAVPALAIPDPLAPAAVTPAYWDEACRHLSRRDRVMKKLIPHFSNARLQSRGDAFHDAGEIDRRPAAVKAAQWVLEPVWPPRSGGAPARPGATGWPAMAVPTAGAACMERARASTCSTSRAASSPARCTSRAGRAWTTRPSSRSSWRSAASAAGPPRCSSSSTSCAGT